MRALSAGRSRSTSAPAAYSTSLKFASMLRLRSSIMTIVIGCTSLAKVEIGLRLAVVVDLEALLLEIRDQPAGRVGHGGIHRDRGGAALERRLLLSEDRRGRGEGDGAERDSAGAAHRGHLAPGPRSTLPGSALVALPPAITGTPLTST